ncbi:unnamed protein product [Spirodela intermedia]|uniref:Uncharacterized protein n=1 Tax=Spirodela intermedia TaxID=51605 RepID=A0A7I8KYH2_SPIIN|nr:unnamed protein product [Spirodela intermedia]
MQEVETIETILVLPSASPFSGFHGDYPREETPRFSHLDTDRNLDVTVRTLRIYAGGGGPAALDPFNAITGALSKALSSYYPLAGSLRRRSAGDRLEVYCAEGQGVPVTRASSRGTLAALNYLDDLGSAMVERLVTLFACGGFSLGMCVHHSFCDGAGSTLFLSAVAEIARGAVTPAVEPVWDRAALLGPRRPPRTEVDLTPVLRTAGRLSDPYGARDGGGAVVREYFHVSDVCLERLRTQLQEASGSSSFTTFEVLVAFIWKARFAARVPTGEKVKLAFSMSIRRLLKPGLPAGYWGNSCVPVYAQTTAGELVARPLWETAQLIKKSKRGVTEEYVRSFIDFQELHYADGITAGENVSGFTDWRHLGHSAVDFGWGSPVSVLSLSFKLLGSLEPCLLLPYPSVGGVKNGGFRALVCLAMDAMPAFREEMKGLAGVESRV